MKITPRKIAAILAVTAAGLAGSCFAGPSNQWTDNVNESVAVPLDTPTQGIARAKVFLADGEQVRAARALMKVVKRWPGAVEAHQLLSQTLRGLGETELAQRHEQLARAHASGAEPVSTLY